MSEGASHGRPAGRRRAARAVAVFVAVVATTVAMAGAAGNAWASPSASPASPSPASPSPASPSPSAGSAAPNARGNGHSPVPPAACRKASNGHLVDCPAAVPASKRPPGARNTTTRTAAVADPATLVDTRTWTSGGGNTFPGADVPFGMVQWSPDTSSRPAGGGYNFGDTSFLGYSLTHISGPGCGAAEDVPILPITGPLSSGNPNRAMTAFSNDNEVAQAGYYSAQSNQPNTITSQFTATPHSAMGRFTFPASTQAGFVIKLRDAQNGEYAPSTAAIVNDHEVSGSETSGHFCGEANNDGQQQEYTVHFDITFDQPFTSSQIMTGSDGPEAVYLSFDTTSNQVVQAKVGTSYVSDGNARLDWQTENPGWNFDAVKSAAQKTWNSLLGRMQVSGGSSARIQMFYSLLYKDFMQPNISSDVNGQYMGADMQVHTIGKGQKNQYGTYSGWDIYHSLSQLQAMLDPAAASDQAQSLLNYYSQDKILQQWGYLNLNNYVMVGDPAQSVIADYYAFGARDFDTATALKDMLEQATTTNDVRPGQNLEDKYGYLPEDGSYRSCCNPHGFVSSLLEYDTEDLALSQFAAALGDQKDSAMLEQRANNWENVFNPANGLLNPRNENGQFVPGITPTTTDHYVEGDAYEYLWNVPNNYQALFNLLGGRQKVDAALKSFLSKPNGFGMFAQLTNEFGFGEQYALDYARDPAATQQIVNNIRNTMYQPGPSLENNDDLGANSSTFIWEMLGMYPENSGSDNLVFNSPGFPHASITLPNGKTITINAPGASPNRFYVKSLKINGHPYHKLYVPFSSLANGATMDWKLGTQPTGWGSAPQDAPPSYGAGTEPAVGSLSSEQVTVAPGGNATIQLGAQNATDRAQSVQASVSVPDGLSVRAGGGTIHLRPHGSASVTLTVHADASTPQTFYRVPISLSDGGRPLTGLTLLVLVAQPGSLLTAFNNAGVSDDSAVGEANFDGGVRSYSAQALAAAKVTPGATVTAGGISYTWPLPAPGYPDNAVAAGQQVTVQASAGTRQLGFLGSASGGPSQGIVTLRYSDGSTAQYWLGLSDWTLNGGRSQPSYGNVVAVSTPYRNTSGGRDNTATDVFSASVPVDPAKTLTGVTLPSRATSGQLHIFAIGTSTSAASGPVISAISPGSASAGAKVTVTGSGFGATQGSGYLAFSDNGINWGAPGNTAAFTVDSWSDTAVTFTVPTPSGPGGEFHVFPGSLAAATVVNSSGATSDTVVLQITPTANPADYYDNAGISPDDNQTCADYDGGGFSYSADALAGAGLTPGSAVNADGLTFTWPNVPACSPDNILAAGQTMLVPGKAGASKLGLLGSSSNGSSQGTITINYTDGTSSTQTVSFTDWAQSPGPGQTAVATMPYRNTAGGSSQGITMYVDATTVPVDSSKTVASITFPFVSNRVGTTAMHIFAVSIG